MGGFNAQHDEAVESLKSAINIIQERIKNMEKTETEEAKKEVAELKALVPEIEEKINDTQDMKKEAENKKEEISASGDAFGSSKVAEVKPVSSIAVKRKAEEQETCVRERDGSCKLKLPVIHHFSWLSYCIFYII